MKKKFDLFEKNFNNINEILFFVSEEIAYILNISKDRASFYTSQYKPQVTMTPTKLQVK